MASLNIEEGAIPALDGKVAIISGPGGSSGIGYAAAKILSSRNCKVHILDLNPPEDTNYTSDFHLNFIKSDITNWSSLRNHFDTVGHVDFAFANAGVSEEMDYFADAFDADGKLEEPTYNVLEVNMRATMNFVKLSLSSMRKGGKGGSIVITTSATAYAAEQSLPVYAAGKLALVGLIRALRSTAIRDNITVNGVAPAATITKLIPPELVAPITKAGLPISDARFVGLALVYSATATEKRRVEAYGKDQDSENVKEGPWNGRVILTMGDQYTELEEPISDSRESWFGRENLTYTRMQQASTDFRPVL